ncbi:hypothetical protein OTU49_016737 [Cherax quadricarinatus]|uniref:Uncharacterized protein n=1 Tax=Cherax quadricarinatus TaxID=27406 RepID=A0AAW0XWE2_CHEQU
MPTAGAMTLMFIGVILFAIILFVTCFKRQVGRMKDRSRRDPHIPGSEAKKALKREIERRLDRVADIYYEPKLLMLEIDNKTNSDLPPYYFRMKAVDNMKYLGKFSLRLNTYCSFFVTFLLFLFAIATFCCFSVFHCSSHIFCITAPVQL